MSRLIIGRRLPSTLTSVAATSSGSQLVAATSSRLFSTTLTSTRSKQQQQKQQKPRPRFTFTAALAGASIAVLATATTVFADAKSDSKSIDYGAVRKAIADSLDKEDHDDGSLGPIYVRLAWHSSGTYDKSDGSGGSNGGRMRFTPESGWGANKGLKIARDELDKIHNKFPQISYGDLYTLAGVVAIEEMGGPSIPWRPGRSDSSNGTTSPPDGRLPDAHKGSSHLRDIFYRMGFNDRDIVALSGAHALGRCHPQNSGFEGPWTRSPTTFSNAFFTLLLEEEWTPRKSSAGEPQFENKKSGKDLMMLPSDLALIQDPSFKKYVVEYANDEEKFFKDFTAAFGKLLELGVPFDSKRR